MPAQVRFPPTPPFPVCIHQPLTPISPSVRPQWMCEACNKYFQRKGDLKRHEKLHTGEK